MRLLFLIFVSIFLFSCADDKKEKLDSINVNAGSSDMRIVMKSSEETILMFFDADNYGLQATYPAQNMTLYSDEEGYIYINAPGKGWMKTKLIQLLGAVIKLAPIDFDFIDLEIGKGSVMHKIAAFARGITIARLEKIPGAKKMSGEKTVFNVYDRVTVTFDSQKRLESLVEGEISISYYYEEQQVTFPDAKVISLPSFLN